MAVRCSLWHGAVGLVAVMVSGCRPDAQPPKVADTVAVSHSADSLAVSRGGVEVWFTLPRTSRASDGKQCLERGLEIRRGRTPIRVPLLYTGESPILWTHCQPLDTYLVDLRTGRPMRERERNRE
jgi:hypothetical protein